MYVLELKTIMWCTAISTANFLYKKLAIQSDDFWRLQETWFREGGGTEGRTNIFFARQEGQIFTPLIF